MAAATYIVWGGAGAMTVSPASRYTQHMADQRLIKLLSDALSGARGLVCACLFGSRARGHETSGSDVDVALLLEQDPPRTLEGLRLDLADELAGAVDRPVDLVVLNRAPADLIHRVL
jgi:predicted nucleotidyltransferase